MSKVCSQIVLTCLYLARFGRPEILWSVNKLARSVTNWTGAGDRRLARLIPYIHHTSDYRQFCHVGNTAQHCRLGFVQDSDFAGDLEDSKSTSRRGGRWILCIFGSRTFVSISWMCKKQTSVSHSSTESENHFVGCWIASGGTTCSWIMGCGDRTVANHQPNQQQETVRGITNPNSNKNGNGDVDQLSHVEYVTTNANSSQGEPQLYIFEDNEAVIKMIIKGRSPTMRQVSRTHRVARLIEYLTESIWTPRCKSNMFTPKTNSQTCQPWISRCFHAAIFFQIASRVWCPASGNWCVTATQTQQRILKSGNKMTLHSSTRTLVRSGELASSASTSKLERGADIQIGRS